MIAPDRGEGGGRAAAAALALVLVAAFALRVWGIDYGLPWLFYFHDEPQIVLRALRFGTGDLNPHFFLWPGILLMYLAFLSYGALFVVGKLAGWWAGKAGFAAAYFQDPSVFYRLPRFQSVAFGVWTVWLAYGLGRTAYGAPVGVAAALGLAVNALHAHYSHLAHPVTAMTAFTALGLWSAVRIATDGGARDLAIAAIALGLGAAAQYHTGLLAVPLAVAVGIRAASDPGWRWRWIVRGFLTGLGGAALFLVLSPYVVLDHATFRSDLAWITAKTEGSLSGVRLGAIEGLIGFTSRCVVPAFGWPLALAAAAGAAWALVRRTRADLVLLAFTLAYVALASRAASLNDRYAIPLLVPGLLFAARLFAAAAQRSLPSGVARSVAPAAAIGLLAIPLALQLVETNVKMTRGDTRIDALRWFEANVPADSRVVLDMLKFWNTASAPLAENRERIEERIAEIRGGISGAGHGASYLEYFRFRLEHPHMPSYYLRGTEMGFSARPLDEYRRAGYEWVIVSEDAAGPMRGRTAPPDSGGPAYYRAVERELTAVAEFRPEPWKRLGPVIRVYRLGTANNP